MKRTSLYMQMMLMIPMMSGAEFFIDVYGGSAQVKGGSFTSTYRRQGIPVAYRRNEFDDSGKTIVGLRGGYWLPNLNWLGGALDFSFFEADAQDSSTRIEVIPMSALLMLRYPMFVSEKFPNGRLYPYVGAGLTFASIDVSSEYGGYYNSYDYYYDTGYGYGPDFRAGIDWQLTRTFGLFMEYRYMSIDFDQSKEETTGGWFTQRYYSEDYDGDMQTHFILGGMSFHF